MHRKNIKNEMDRIIDILKKDQDVDGSWNYPFETGISTDAYMIILLRTLEVDDEELVKQLVERILNKQETNGAWKLYYDEEEGNLTATVEAYYSLLYSGYVNNNDKRMLAAKRFILKNGGIEKCHMFTKVMLALTNQYPWPTFFPIPIEILLLPTTFPINFYDFSVYGRANLVPIMIVADKKYSKKTSKSPDLKNLFLSNKDISLEWERSGEWKAIYIYLKDVIKNLVGLPGEIHAYAIEQGKQYMLNRIEKDGTFYSYFSSTFLMIFALLSLGYSNRDPLILKAVDGLKRMKTTINDHFHIQYTTATVWNTSLISFAMQRAGVATSDPVIKRANQYLLKKQHHQYGDWAIHNPQSLPGGWGFSEINTINPDIDDTTAVLRSLSQETAHNPSIREAWDKGLKWLISMQNDDGGWAAFEKNVNKSIINLLPIEGAKYLLTDPSSADLTGRTLEFLGKYTKMSINHSSIKKAVKWLEKNQEKDGSWYGRWGICYIYGTWAAITGLKAVRIPSNHRSIQKGVEWLKKIQNVDGGWGESCKSDINNKYIPLGVSTLTHTAWAVDALIAASKVVTPEIEAGVKFLVNRKQLQEWTITYPKGQAMGGDFYIHYHSYRYIFPLLALAHYQKKFHV
ncbi:squalene--hopene cyclase [Neobacillus sp. D3-1R]|uniref:squalene--hopene cyclase n=1 Tax=Neobacillus sp. D3-1R TaxID=3445778 RepID=UPI003FA163FD